MKGNTLTRKLIYYVSVVLYFISNVFSFCITEPKEIKIKINENSEKQDITGWGTSACWWAQVAGKSDNAEEVTKLFFSKEGLGLNIFRYNIGAGEKDNPNSRLSKDSWRSSESFLVWNEEKGEFEYDWTRDEGARKILDLALSYGCVDTVVLFANSPHYSMTVSGQASGGLKEKQSNLRKDAYEAYADYFLDITEHFLSLGVPVKYISPINEPQWKWGGDWVGQEGCHYEIDEVVALGKIFAKKIVERGLDVKLSLAESGKVSEHAMECADKLFADENIKAVSDNYAYHSYGSDNYYLKYNFGQYLKKNHPDVTVEMSEWCELPCETTTDDIKGALIFARTISDDLTLSGCSSWNNWVAVNEDMERADAPVGATSDFSQYKVAKRYYGFAHFSKFVPVGSKLIDFDMGLIPAKTSEIKKAKFQKTSKTNVACFETPDGNIVAVIVNSGKEKKLSFNMEGYSMSVYTTDKDVNIENTYNGMGSDALTIGAESLCTIVFSK